MIQAVFLDSGPLGLATQRAGVPNAEACRQWIANLELAGIRIVVPEVIDYEVRRELIRAKQTAGVARLNAFNSARPDRYLPITTDAMRLAADLWAQARTQGVPTADARALDADVVLAAQALTAGLLPSEIVVATSNVRHITRFVPCDTWNNITP